MNDIRMAPPSSWRRWFPVVAVAGVVVIGLGLAGGVLKVSSSDSLPVSFSPADGLSEVKVPPSSAWQLAHQEVRLVSGDSVRTLPGGNALLTYADGSVLAVAGGAEVKVSESSRSRDRSLLCALQTVFACGDEPLSSFVTTVAAGSAQARIQRAPNSVSLFQLQTPNSVAEARSTVFEVQVDKGGRALWRSIEGQVSVGYLIQGEYGTLAATATLLDGGAALEVKALPPVESAALVERAGLMAAVREAVHLAATSEAVIDLAREGKGLSFPTPIGRVAGRPTASPKTPRKSQAGASCLECHQELNASLQSKSRHQPFVTGNCVSCHSYSHDGAGEHRTAAGDIALCSSCHARSALGFSHPVGPQLVDAVTRGPLTCSSSCHDPHGSPYKALSRVGEGDKLCTSCHNPGTLGR